jgi:branched-chain amino acid transport system permease protein
LLVITTIYAGLVLGSIYAMVAVGFNIVFIATGTVNFAQAQYAMLGTLMAYITLVHLHINLIFAIPLGFALGALLGFTEERVAIRYLPRQSVHGELVTTVGFSVLVEGLAIASFGTNPYPVPSVITSNSAISLFNGVIYPYQIVMIAVSVAVVIAFEMVARKTLVGLSSLATSEDKTAAILRGINVRQLQVGAYMLAGGLLVAVGPFIATTTYATSTIGDTLNIQAFVAMSIGGFGSPKGALIGGLLSGLLQAFVGRYLNSDLENLSLLLLLLVVLMVRPYGLFGERVERAV